MIVIMQTVGNCDRYCQKGTVVTFTLRVELFRWHRALVVKGRSLRSDDIRSDSKLAEVAHLMHHAQASYPLREQSSREIETKNI